MHKLNHCQSNYLTPPLLAKHLRRKWCKQATFYCAIFTFKKCAQVVTHTEGGICGSGELLRPAPVSLLRLQASIARDALQRPQSASCHPAGTPRGLLHYQVTQ